MIMCKLYSHAGKRVHALQAERAGSAGHVSVTRRAWMLLPAAQAIIFVQLYLFQCSGGLLRAFR